MSVMQLASTYMSLYKQVQHDIDRLLREPIFKWLRHWMDFLMFLLGIPEALSQVWQHALVRICWSQGQRAFSRTFLMLFSLLAVSNNHQGISPCFPGLSSAQYEASAWIFPHQTPGIFSGFNLAESTFPQSIFHPTSTVFPKAFLTGLPDTQTRAHTHAHTHTCSHPAFQASDPIQHFFNTQSGGIPRAFNHKTAPPLPGRKASSCTTRCKWCSNLPNPKESSLQVRRERMFSKA